METKQHNKLVPKLRFPEFEEDGEWDEKVLSEVCEMQAGKFVKASEIKEKLLDGLFPCYGGNGLRGYVKSNTHKGKFPLIGRQGALCGNVKLVDGIFHATEHAVVVTPKKDADTLWLFYELDLLNLNQYATGQAQPGLSVSNIGKVKLGIPRPKEQQKIANCLSSLDTLITAETEKRDHLKDHKKGLLQQLFPAKGESKPQYRFPEFVGDGDWEEKEIGRLFKSYNLGGNYSNSIKKTDKPLIKMGNLGRGNIILNKIQYIEESEVVDEDDKIKTGDLFLNTRNTLELVGKVAIWRNELPLAYYNSNLMRIEFKNNYFMNYRLNSDEGINELKKYATGTTSVAAIYTKDLLKLKLFIPGQKEQQKIADCFSSVDQLIQSQTEIIKALKEHKKGLMQQLFPNVNNIGL